ncbi:TraG family conjugative transposon ATPase [Zunongwangia sp. SCSIO 43204]|uniref:TraG family conjugative transposon ATPase n=1 Tax=Zunongwangia sp. SCSIO 43204 TaxID=2779359 RepID=UPI001CA9DF07|nr:TraG family conjugative transposon ATPase [Zunongwangia sp. SCSIO 43204]UAB84179.1 TraG family conjugative transposon ATPase [Zunongwangia sp. SCSIO 43204]
MKRLEFSKYHPLIHMDGNLAYANNGNVILGYSVHLPEIYSLSEKDFEKLHSSWFQSLKSLPSGCLVHKQDTYHKKEYSASALPKQRFLEKATYTYFKGREYLYHECHLFFVLPAGKSIQSNRFVNPFKKLDTKIPKRISARVDQFVSSVSDAVSFLNNSRKISLSPLSPEQALQLTEDYFNGYHEDHKTDMLLHRDGVSIGEHHYGAMAINNELCFGDQLHTSKINEAFTSDTFSFQMGFIDGLGLALHENHMINQIMILDDKYKWRRILEQKIEALKKSVNFGSQNKIILGKIQEILDRINDDEQSRIIRGHLNIIYWTKKPYRLTNIASKINSEFKELDIIPYAPKGEALKHYLLNSYWAHATNFKDHDLYVSELKHALCLLINNTSYRSDPQGIIFNDRAYNIPVFKDVWDERKKRIKARNFAIFAPTGEGKSFLANNILRQYFEQGIRLVIIDLGGSYTKLAKLYPGQYTVMRYHEGESLGINPFYIPTAKDLTTERLEDLAIFIFELLAPGTRIEKAQSVALKKILKAYYQQESGIPSLAGFYHFIDDSGESLPAALGIKMEYFNRSDFLHVMSEYVENGIYSFLFEDQEDQTYKLEDKRLIIFELDEVRDNKEILSVMLKLIKTAVQRTIWRNRSERGIILFDEFAKQLKFDNVLESVEFYYQAIRKQNGAIGIILQSINQLPGNTTAASILENTQVIYSLNNEKGYDELASRLKLSDHDLTQLRSIRNNFSGTRKYTEIFIKIGKESNIFRLEVPPEVYAAYLTDGAENEAIMANYNKTNDMEAAIKEFLNP